MTEARSMQVAEQSAASNPEALARARPAVERWLALTGLIPLPAFIALHVLRELWLAGAADVAELVRSEPSLLARITGACLVILPLSLHVALGAARLLTRGQAARTLEPDVAEPARRVSRVTSVVALCFVVFHLRDQPLAVWLGEADARDAGLRLIEQLSNLSYGVPLHASAYLLGIAATLAHTGLGVHRALLLLGLLPSPGRRAASARACAACAVLLFLAAAAAVIRVASGTL